MGAAGPRIVLSPGLSLSRDGPQTEPRAHRKWEKRNPSLFQFRANETIQVKEWASPEWLLGSLYGQSGIFPATYVSCPTIQSVPKGATYNR